MQHQRPRLKAGVDLQLHNAFNEGNWPVVVRLAEKRASLTKDQYYEMMKLAAGCLSDDVNTKYATVEAVYELANAGTVINDIESIELLEWATRGLIAKQEFPHIFGPLRSRTAKAKPKDGAMVIGCLESCILNWDLPSAQQIATLLDRTSPQERKFMFWNIVITHLLSARAETSTKEKALYGMLAKKQIERAAEASEKAARESQTLPARSIQTEEEVNLLYEIIIRHGSADDFMKLVHSPVFSPLEQFNQGRKEPLFRAFEHFSQVKDWESLFNVCHSCLLKGFLGQDDAGNKIIVASDFSVWRHFILASKELSLTDTLVLEKVKTTLDMLDSSVTDNKFFLRTMQLARLDALFTLTGFENLSEEPADHGKSPRMVALCKYIRAYATMPYCFDDVKSFFEKLSPKEMVFVAYESEVYNPDVESSLEANGFAKLLVDKLRICALTSPSMRTTGAEGAVKCFRCLQTIQKGYCNICLDEPNGADLMGIAISAYEADPSTHLVAEMLLNTVTKLLLTQLPADLHITKLSGETLKVLISNVALLSARSHMCNNHRALQLLEVMLSIRLGAPHHGYPLWNDFGVKRTIMDSMASVFYDRMPTIDPDILNQDAAVDEDLIGLLISHFRNSLRNPMPRRLLDAFEAENYNSILRIPSYQMNLRKGCTRVMSVVEEARMMRMIGQPTQHILHDPILADVVDDTNLREARDEGSFPSTIFGRAGQALHERLSIGPAPTSCRLHLSLLSEMYHEIMTAKPAPGFKTSLQAQVAQQVYILEMMSRLSNSLSRFIADAAGGCTIPEFIYFNALQLITSLIPLTTASDRSLTEDVNEVFSGIQHALVTLRSIVFDHEGPEIERTVAHLSSLHDLAMFRDTAIATKLACDRILMTQSRVKERDAPGKSNINKDIVSKVDALVEQSREALKLGKDLVAKLNKELGNKKAFKDALEEWMKEETSQKQGISEGFSTSLTDLINSWQKTIGGWAGVKWEC